jgi:hypothetical protein
MGLAIAKQVIMDSILLPYLGPDVGRAMLLAKKINPQNRVEKEAIGRLRMETWRFEGYEPIEANGDCFLENHDEHGEVWAIFIDHVLAASGRVCFHPTCDEFPESETLSPQVIKSIKNGPYGVFSRLVVRPGYHKLGLSRMLDDLRTTMARSLGAQRIVLSTTFDGPRFHSLEKKGFAFCGFSLPSTSWPNRPGACWLMKPLF